MANEEIKKVLELHRKWLNGEEGGVRADLSGAKLSGAKLSGAKLSGANLSGANLSGADLSGADLSGADLSGANFRGANLRGADLSCADLRNADLIGADLRDADLIGADLRGADLSDSEKHRLGIILSKARIGYKKLDNGIICKLSIPKGAIVFCINGSKCRTNKCKVLEGEGVSGYDKKTKYKVGKTLKIKNFDLMYNVECSTGIHFFWTKKEARNY